MDVLEITLADARGLWEEERPAREDSHYRSASCPATPEEYDGVKRVGFVLKVVG